MGRIGPCVSIWFSTNKARRSLLLTCRKIAYKISKAGYGLLPAAAGIMEAGNKGTHLGGGTSVGLNMYCLLSSISIILIEIKPEFDYFFVRKVMFVKIFSSLLLCLVGFGTLDELFEAMTLKQKNPRIPIILVGRVLVRIN
jgi:predicted Rossmann-fold nucleotide-binding protein